MDLMVLAAALFLSNAQAACGSFTPLEFNPIQTHGQNGAIQIDRVRMEGFDVDVTSAPVVITNEKTKASCKTEIKGVEGDDNDAFALAGSGEVLLRSVDDVLQHYTLVELKTCREVWRSPYFIGGHVEPRTLRFDASCGLCEETKQFAGECECSAAEVWTLNASCKPEYDESASRVLTRQQVKIAFTGKKKIKGARSAGAQLVN